MGALARRRAVCDRRSPNSLKDGLCERFDAVEAAGDDAAVLGLRSSVETSARCSGLGIEFMSIC